MTAIDPGVRNLSSEFAPRELMRLEFDGRIVFADTFSGLILGGINLIINCYFFLLLFTTETFCKKRTNFFTLFRIKSSPPKKNLKFAFSDYVNDDQLKPN